MDNFKSWSEKLSPFAQKLQGGFTQVKQWSQEQMGTADEVTELPRDYVELEKRFDAVVSVYNSLSRLGRAQVAPQLPDINQIQGSLVDFSRSVTQRIQASSSHAGAARAYDNETSSSSSKSITHAVATTCQQQAQIIGPQEPLGAGVGKFGNALEAIGETHLKMCHSVNTKFLNLVQTELNTTISNVQRARKDVQNTRLTLDAHRSSFKHAAGPSDAAQVGVEQAEDQFVTAVEKATKLMQDTLENPETLRILADFALLQVEYHKRAFEVLSSLSAEMDELQVTQAALYRSSHQ